MFDKQREEQKAIQKRLTSTVMEAFDGEKLWPTGAQFTFEIYWHAQLLSAALLKVYSQVKIELNQVDVTQSIPLSMSNQGRLLLEALQILSQNVQPSRLRLGRYWVLAADNIDVTATDLCNAYGAFKLESSSEGDGETIRPEKGTMHDCFPKIKAAMEEHLGKVLLDPQKAAADYPEVRVPQQRVGFRNHLKGKLWALTGSTRENESTVDFTDVKFATATCNPSTRRSSNDQTNCGMNTEFSGTTGKSKETVWSDSTKWQESPSVRKPEGNF